MFTPAPSLRHVVFREEPTPSHAGAEVPQFPGEKNARKKIEEGPCAAMGAAEWLGGCGGGGGGESGGDV